MAQQMREDTLGDLVDLFSEQVAEPQSLQRMRHLARNLDELFFLEESGELAIDRDALMKIGRDNGIVPPEHQDRVIRETEKHLGPKVKPKGAADYVAWCEAARLGLPIQPVPAATLRAAGISKSVSVDDARLILRQQYPDIPSFWLDADAALIRDTTVKALAHNQTVWDCAVRNLGFWGAMAVFAAVGSLLIVGTATGPWGVPLAIFLIGVLGGTTATIVLNCLANPNWAAPI
jgi:hypothetical protein